MTKDYFGDILLASNSPRRRLLLTEAGFNVTVLSGLSVDETYPSELPVEKIPRYLAEVKSIPYQAVADKEVKCLVTADTIVVLDSRVIGKPSNKNEAAEFLKSLSGRKHRVISGVNLYHPHLGSESFSEQTEVKFSSLSESIINHYVDVYSPLDKAGAYGIQEWIGLVGVERIEGDFYNIMGFPVCSFIKKYLFFTRSLH